MQITIRGLDPDLKERLRRGAAEAGVSLNRYVVTLLQRGTGAIPDPVTEHEFHDLDALAGSWSEAEADAFDASLREQRRVDPEMSS